ncbi:hypothetical protein PAXINDRAFT_11058 [Paxillus involutus ATCC 200175]|nr:hypothetical protein PAXINDRAFT_11058 [Paxillus involutus ATCC 200175]
MRYLVPELHRCRSIRFNTIQVSSLPPLQAFSGRAPLLRQLELGCARYLLWVEEEPGDVAVPLDLVCPELETLHLNGRNFYPVCPPLSESAPTFAYDLWLSHLPYLTSLTISDYMASGRNEGLSMAGMLRALQELTCLEKLAIHDLLRIRRPLQWAVSFFAAVILQEGIDTLDIIRCDVDDVDWEDVHCTELTLVGMEDCCDIRQILKYSDIHELNVYGCPSFDDNLVYSLMGKNPPVPEGVSARRLRSLDISECDNFSMGALKKMCEWRERSAWDEASWQNVDDLASTEFEVCSPITSVYVYGKNLTPEDREWLKSYNSRFRNA